MHGEHHLTLTITRKWWFQWYSWILQNCHAPFENKLAVWFGFKARITEKILVNFTPLVPENQSWPRKSIVQTSVHRAHNDETRFYRLENRELILVHTLCRGQQWNYWKRLLDVKFCVAYFLLNCRDSTKKKSVLNLPDKDFNGQSLK